MSIRWIMFEDSPIVLFAPTGLNSPPVKMLPGDN